MLPKNGMLGLIALLLTGKCCTATENVTQVLHGCSKINNINTEGPSILITCPNKLYRLNSKTLQIKSDVNLGKVEPVFGCNGTVTAKNVCKDIDRIDLNVPKCEEYIDYESSLLIYNNENIIICSNSQTLVSERIIKGFCQIRNSSSGKTIEHNCTVSKTPDSFIGLRRTVTQDSPSSIGITTTIKSENFERNVLLVLNDYAGTRPNPFAISIHEIHPEKAIGVVEMFEYQFAYKNSFNSLLWKHMYLAYKDSLDPDLAPNFKHVFNVKNGDDTNGLIIIYNDSKDSGRRHTTVIAHMCMDINGLGTIGNNPRNIFQTYREVPITVDGSGELVAAELIDNTTLVLVMKDGKVYSVTTELVERAITDAIAGESCNLSSALYREVPWAKQSKSSCPMKSKTRKMSPQNKICSSDYRSTEFIQMGISNLNDYDNKLVQYLWRLEKPLILDHEVYDLQTEPTSMKVVAVKEKKINILIFTDVDGKLHKLKWYGTNNATPYYSEPFASKESNKDLNIKLIKANAEYGWISSSVDNTNTITKITIPGCSSYKTCQTCLDQKSDPQCSWCIYNGKCSLRCPDVRHKDKFEVHTLQNCPIYDEVGQQRYFSNSTLNNKMKRIPLTIKNIDASLDKDIFEFICIWELPNGKKCPSSEMSHYRRDDATEYYCKPAIKAGRCAGVDCDVDCHKPDPNDVGKIGLKVGIAVKPSTSTESVDINVFVSTTLYYINCTQLTSCGSCLQYRSSDCKWCHAENTCVSGDGSRCAHPQDVSKNSAECPKFTIANTSIYYRNKSDTIVLNLNNRDNLNTHYTSDLEFKCDVQVNDKTMSFSAKQTDNDDRIHCKIDWKKFESPHVKTEEISFNTHPNSITAQYDMKIKLFAMKSGKDRKGSDRIFIDPENGDTIVVYNCPPKYECGDCSSLPVFYNCSYCNDTCDVQVCQTKAESVNKCMKPIIDMVVPNNATTSGDTLIQVIGQNFNDKEQFTTLIGEYPCIYEKPATNFRRSYFCRLRRKKCPEKNVPVKLTQDGHDVVWSGQFRFLQSQVYSISPEKMLQIGGQMITLTGKNLNVGRENNMEVHVQSKSATHECKLKNRSESTLTCWLADIEQDPKLIGQHSLSLKIDGSDNISQKSIQFEALPLIDTGNYYSIESGGIPLIITGSRVKLLPNSTTLKITDHDTSETYQGECVNGNSGKNVITCMSPDINKVNVKYIFDIYYAGYRIKTTDSTRKLTLEYLSAPIINTTASNDEKASDEVKKYGIRIEGKNFCLGRIKSGSMCDDMIISWSYRKSYSVYLVSKDANRKNEKIQCADLKIDNEQLYCKPGKDEILSGTYSVVVKIGRKEIKAIETLNLTTVSLKIIVIGIGLFLVVAFIAVLFVRKRQFKKIKKQEIHDRLLKENQSKEMFKGLVDLANTMRGTDQPFHNQESSSLPFRNYQSFVLHFMFPPGHKDSESYHQKLQPAGTLTSHRGTIERNCQMNNFLSVLGQREFLTVFVKTLDAQSSFKLSDRNNVAAFIMIALQNRLSYATVVLQYLMVEMIDSSRDSQLMTLMRSSGTICEKMLSFWFTMLLHRTLFERTGAYLYKLCEAVKDITYSQPVDQITGHAKVTLSEQFLMRLAPNDTRLDLHIRHTEGEGEGESTIMVECLYCDTIDQVKSKTMDALYSHTPFSVRPRIDDYDLEYHDPSCLELHKTKRVMQNIDSSSLIEGQFRKLNTIEHYANLFNQSSDFFPKNSQAYVKLQPKPHSYYGSTMTRSNQDVIVSETSSLLRSNTPLAFSRTENQTDQKIDYHMIKPEETEMARELFLTRMLVAQQHLHSYSEQLFESIFSAYQGSHGPPLPIKYIFDFLDEQADRVMQERNQKDINLAHIWKSNCLPLRFWVNLIKNPDFLFDIDKPPSVDHTLTTIGQALMHACSTYDQNSIPGGNSNRNQQKKREDHNFSKIIQDSDTYQSWVKEYYAKIKEMVPLPSEDFRHFLDDENNLHQDEFNTMAAVSELWSYVTQYYNELTVALSQDPEASKFKLAATLQRIEKGQFASNAVYSQNSSHISAHATSYGSQHALPSYNQSNISCHSPYHSNSALAQSRPIPAPRSGPRQYND